MKVKYDKEIDAKYITFKQGEIAKTTPLEDWFIVDYAKDGSVIGVEILDASKHRIGVSEIGDDFIGYFETQALEQDIPKLEIPEEKLSYRTAAVSTN